MTDQEKADSLWADEFRKPVESVQRTGTTVTIQFDGDVPAFDVALLCAFWHPESMEVTANPEPYKGCDCCADATMTLSGCRL